jgi:hypothetical protein
MGKVKCSQCGSKLHVSCGSNLAQINGLQIFDKEIQPELQERLEALIEDLHEPLLAHLSKKREPFKPLLIRIRILGSDENSAKPWIVVHSPASVVKDVESFFSKDFARNACADLDIAGGLKVAYVGRPLRLRAGPLTEVEVSFAFTDRDHLHSWSGPITLTQLSTMHRATTGGMLVIGNPDGIDSIFGLTVGHLLHHENASSSHTPDYDVDAFVSKLESGATLIPQQRPLGRIADSSFSKHARDLDWALIQFSEATLLSDFVAQRPSYEKFIEGNCKGNVTFRPNLLPSGTAKLSSLPASAILPVGESFVRIHPIVISGVQGKSSIFELGPTNTANRLRTTSR